MPQVEFVGDWDPATIAAATQALRKSLGMGAEQGAEETLQTTVAGLSPRQKKLIDLLRKAGTTQQEEDGDPCDAPPEWDVYPLRKAAWVGQQRVTHDGTVLRFNANRRWERVRDDSGGSVAHGNPASIAVLSAIRFPVATGDYGPGVYLPVVDQPGGGLKLRVRLAVDPLSIIPEERFEQIAADFTQDLESVLDGYGVKGVARVEQNAISLLMIRDPKDLHILGSIGGDHVPTGNLSFQLINVQSDDSGMLLDIEITEKVDLLNKSLSQSRRTTFPSRSELNGSPLLPGTGIHIDRSVVNDALTWLRQQGGSLHDLPLQRLTGVPDFAPEAVIVAVPGDQVIYLCPNDLDKNMRQWLHSLSERLSCAEGANAISADDALKILASAAALRPHEWLAHRLLSVAGAITINPPETYLQILGSRGLSYWGNEALVAACVGEDYRTSITGAAIPNLVTLEWDCACPEYARMAQRQVSFFAPKNRHALPSMPEHQAPEIRL